MRSVVPNGLRQVALHGQPVAEGNQVQKGIALKLSRTVSYALQAMHELARDTKSAPLSCREIAKPGEMPERFLLQIMRNLVTHGLLKSVRGVEGGYLLARPMEQISLLEVIEAIEGPLAASIPCGLGLSDELESKLYSICQEITLATRSKLSQVNLAEFSPSAPGNQTAN